MFNFQSSEESTSISNGKLSLPGASHSLFMLKVFTGLIVDDSWFLQLVPVLISAEESITKPAICSGCSDCRSKRCGVGCAGFCDGCVWNGEMMGPLWTSRGGLQLKLMTLHEEPSCILLGF
jgi:hypothetical protein